VREELRAATELHGKRLDAIVGELEVKITDIARYAKMRRLNQGAEAAQQYDDMARAIEAFIETQKRVDPTVRESVGIPTSALISRLQVARDMAAVHRKYVTKGAPVIRPYRDGLARAARRIVVAHCFDIRKRNLRRAIAAVLKSAGYDFPEPRKNSDKFDRMCQPLPPTFDEADKDAKEAVEELEERLRGVPI
jgi:phage regulator Rha-like protein